MIRKHTVTIMHSYLICSCKLKKQTIVTIIKHNADLQKRDLKHLNKLQRIQHYLITVLHNSQIQLIFKSNMINGKRN